MISDILHAFFYRSSLNLTWSEIFLLSALAGGAWLMAKRRHESVVLYSIFLILYITLLRRAPGYDEQIHWNLRFIENADDLAGMGLNVLLYFPFGCSCGYWLEQKRWSWWRAVVLAGLTALELSVGCEALQYATGRGWADANDVICNTAGAVIGIMMFQMKQYIRNTKVGKE